jgi:hypothetical protein
VDEKDYKYEVMLCFWFAIYRETLAESQLLFQLDDICKVIMRNLRRDGAVKLKEKKMEREKNTKKVFSMSMMSNSASQDASGNNLSHENAGEKLEILEDLVSDPFSDKMSNSILLKKDSQLEDEFYNFRSLEELLEIKWLLQETEVGKPFNTNILRIALNMKEEKIAAVLVAFFQIVIREEMITRAIKT